MSNNAVKSSMRHLSMLGAWALAFGCAVGSDAFVMPWNDFLPKAGPLGTVLGIFIGSLIMTIVAWNFHYMMNRQPGPGGTYAYASAAFGHDHGFLCGVFLAFAYLAIVWLDVTALVVVAHYTLGDTFRFGFRYTIHESNIYLGDIMLSVAVIAVASAICCRRRLSGVVQSVLAVILAVGILLCFGAAVINHHGGLESMRPFFAPDRGSGLLQTLNILAIAPWLFVGFEAISNSSSEFRFSVRKSFRVMLAALVTAVIAYTCLTSIPVLTLGEGASSWTGAVADLANSGNEPDYHAFDAASRFFGKAGIFLIGVTLIGAIFTNLVGNTVAASRLVATPLRRAAWWRRWRTTARCRRFWGGETPMAPRATPFSSSRRWPSSWCPSDGRSSASSWTYRFSARRWPTPTPRPRRSRLRARRGTGARRRRDFSGFWFRSWSSSSSSCRS